MLFAQWLLNNHSLILISILININVSIKQPMLKCAKNSLINKNKLYIVYDKDDLHTCLIKD